MSTFSAKHPILFGALLFFASLAAALPPMFVVQQIGHGVFSVDFSSALARLLVALILILVFRKCFHWDRSFTALGLAIPGVAFAVWNIAYNLLGSCVLVDPSQIPVAVVCGLAPGVFEEVIFRGIEIDALRRSGKTTMQTLLLSTLLFSAIHLTNAVGMDLVSVLVQVCYSLSIGLVLGAIYLVSNDLATVILLHATIDICSQIFATHPTATSIPGVIAFLMLLALESAYALWLARKAEQTT